MTFQPYKNLSEVKAQVELLKSVTMMSSINTPALYGSNVFRVTYLSSGCPGTADYNCFKMSKAVRLLYRIHSGISLDDKVSEDLFLKNFSALVGTKDLVAGLAGGGLLDIFRFFGMKLETVCFITDFEALWADSDYVELDLLGFGIGKFELPGVKTFCWPVLSNPLNPSKHYKIRPKTDRLGRSLIFHKDKDLENEAENEGIVYN